MALKQVTAPANEPLGLDDVKTYLRVDGDDEDTFITSLITAARTYCETFQNRAYLTQTFDLTLDHFPRFPLSLPRPPLQSVESFTYIDKDAVSTLWDVSNYIVDMDSEPGRIGLAYGIFPPRVTLQPMSGVKIRFTAGYGDVDAVPAVVKQAMTMLIGHWYEHREAVLTGTASKEIEFAVTALLSPDRVIPL
ncbi:head-tail connector protein [Alicyclobacillus fodiniaquatilis]|uniref:Head-tail connector protein n=1 Tax=Alicyclobacillus fodiniaquatilis TaxID=1661150 RepID=A0ABW4JI76_9BACL